MDQLPENASKNDYHAKVRELVDIVNSLYAYVQAELDKRSEKLDTESAEIAQREAQAPPPPPAWSQAPKPAGKWSAHPTSKKILLDRENQTHLIGNMTAEQRAEAEADMGEPVKADLSEGE